jgi:hypothetical protein
MRSRIHALRKHNVERKDPDLPGEFYQPRNKMTYGKQRTHTMKQQSDSNGHTADFVHFIWRKGKDERNKDLAGDATALSYA